MIKLLLLAAYLAFLIGIRPLENYLCRRFTGPPSAEHAEISKGALAALDALANKKESTTGASSSPASQVRHP